MDKGNSSQNKDSWHFRSPPLSWLMEKLEGMRITWEQQEQQVGATAIVVFACFCLALAFKRKTNAEKGRRAWPAYHRSLSMAALHGRKMAFHRIMDSQHARVDASALLDAEPRFRGLLEQEQQDFKELQSVATKLEMSGKEDKAKKMLSDAWKKAKDKHRHHEAYELEMLLVEMLIYQGKYINALNKECLKDEEISDARRPLYKAIIHVMLGDSRRAEFNLEKCNEIRRQMHAPFCNDDDLPYEKFEKIVNLLKQEIKHDGMGTH